MEKNMKNEMETGVVQELQERNLSYHIGETKLLITMYIPIMVAHFLNSLTATQSPNALKLSSRPTSDEYFLDDLGDRRVRKGFIKTLQGSHRGSRCFKRIEKRFETSLHTLC